MYTARPISPLRRFSLVAGVLAVVTLGVFALSDTLRLPMLLDGHDKALHVAAFSACGFILMLGAARREMMAMGFILAGLAIGLEWAQPAITATREASLADVAASMLGIVLGAGVALAATGVARSATPKVRAR